MSEQENKDKEKQITDREDKLLNLLIQTISETIGIVTKMESAIATLQTTCNDLPDSDRIEEVKGILLKLDNNIDKILSYTATLGNVPFEINKRLEALASTIQNINAFDESLKQYGIQDKVTAISSKLDAIASVISLVNDIGSKVTALYETYHDKNVRALVDTLLPNAIEQIKVIHKFTWKLPALILILTAVFNAFSMGFAIMKAVDISMDHMQTMTASPPPIQTKHFEEVIQRIEASNDALAKQVSDLATENAALRREVQSLQPKAGGSTSP